MTEYAGFVAYVWARAARARKMLLFGEKSLSVISATNEYITGRMTNRPNGHFFLHTHTK